MANQDSGRDEEHPPGLLIAEPAVPRVAGVAGLNGVAGLTVIPV